MTDPLAPIRRKLEKWELEHLREHCAEQALRIEELERQLHAAQLIAEQWQSECEQHREQAMAEGKTVGLHINGHVEIL